MLPRRIKMVFERTLIHYLEEVFRKYKEKSSKESEMEV